MAITYLSGERIQGSSIGSVGTQSYNAGALTNVTLSNSNLTATSTSSAWGNKAYSTLTFNPANIASGAEYQFTFTTSDDTKNGMVGFDRAPASNSGAGNSDMDFGMYLVGNASSQNYISTAGGGSENWNGGQAYTTSSVLKMTMDSSGNVKFYIGGSQFGNTITGGSGDYHVVFYPYDSGFNTTITSWSDPTQDEKASLTTATDSLGSNGDITNTGTATLDTTNQKLGTGCLDFDGSNDYINATALQTNNAMTTTGTISFWFKPDVVSGRYLWSIGDTNGTDARIYFEQQAANKWVVFCEQSASPQWKVDSTVSTFSAGTWYHCVVTHAGGSSYGTVKLWINGVDRSTNSNNGTTWNKWCSMSGADNMFFGFASHDGNTGYGKADGLYDDIGVWNRALSSSEVAALYNSGTGAKCSTITSGLVAYYSCDSATITNEASATNSNIPTGTRFEEINTRKIFRMKDGGWVEKGTA
jgi:hypothetical protein